MSKKLPIFENSNFYDISFVKKTPCQEVSFDCVEYSRFYAEKCDFCIFWFTHFGTVKKNMSINKKSESSGK